MEPGRFHAERLPARPLTIDDVEQLESAYPNLTDVLPLAPPQEGLLFHALVDEVDVYTAQIRLDLDGELNPDRLRQAAQAVLDRHDNLRVAFHHEGLDEPVQVVRAEVRAPWRQDDLPAGRRKPTPSRRPTREPFDLTVAPLLRWRLLRLDAGRQRLILTSHHLLWDGGSVPLVLQEVFVRYAGSALPAVVPYRDYLRWLHAQDSDTAIIAWREALAGAMPSLVVSSSRRGKAAAAVAPGHDPGLRDPARGGGPGPGGDGRHDHPGGLGGRAGQPDRRDGRSVRHDVLLGRPPEIPGIERMIGLLANTLPVRVRMLPGDTVGSLLRRIRDEQAVLLGRHHLRLTEVRRAGGGVALFDTTTVFTNYPLDPAAFEALGTGLRLSGMDNDDATHYPLRMAVVPGGALNLRLGYCPIPSPRRKRRRFSMRCWL